MKNFNCLIIGMMAIALMQQILPQAQTQATAEPKPLAPLKIVLVGDSTVAPGGGWGQEFAALLKPQAQCVNVASPGRSSKSYRDEGRWKKALALKPNYIFIQFGHNDMPGKGPERETDPRTSYPENLVRYVAEARAIGAKPILVTPLTRRFWTADGRNRSDLVAYAQAASRVAKENDVPLVDLHARSVEQFNAIGRTAAKQYDRPNPDPTKPDATHLSEFGAQQTALLVAREVQRVEPELGKYVNLPPLAVLTNTSLLWGKNGENWSPRGRLSDWSFAGYHSGESPIPTPPVVANVRDFGARGDGVADDTDAFKRAIAATEKGALLIPAGRYKLSDRLTINKSDIVLRGEGPEKSVLLFTKSLEELNPKSEVTMSGRPTSGYSWSGGLVWVEGKQLGAEIGKLKSIARRGDYKIELAAPANVQVGQKIEINQRDPGDKSLINYFFAGQTGDISKLSGVRTAFVSRVTGVDGAVLTLERPLFNDVDPKWGASVKLFEPSVREVGIENLGFEFSNRPYEGHFTEFGFNPFTFLGVADCWARDLRIFNADSGPFVRGNFVTVQNIVLDANRAPDKLGNQGHHGITVGNDTLLRDFDYRIKFIHDISAEYSSGSVITQGKGVDLNFDNHKRVPFANLYTNIDTGLGTRVWASSGGGGLGRHSASWSTWWNIRAAQPQVYPPEDFGPDTLNFVGLPSDQTPILEPQGRWFEPSQQVVQPANLYDAQLTRRLGVSQK